MKIQSTLFFLLFLANFCVAQTPFTIDSSNFPVFGVQNFDRKDQPTGINLTPSANGNWDFSAFYNNNTFSNIYIEETDPAYTALGIDVYLSDFKFLNATLGYEVYYEFDFNNLGVFESAIYVGEQNFPLTQLTGGPNDFMLFPLQGSYFDSGRQVMKFPATYKSAWKSKSRRVVDFSLTVAAAGLNNTPCQHAFTVFREDTISGWGKMRVYASGQPSIPYEVLINQSTTTTVDSFYVGGSPAPAQLLQVFGASQGQSTKLNRTTAYRAGNSTFLSNFVYENNSFTNPARTFFDIDNLSTVGVSNQISADYSTLLFPNPSNSGEINFQISGNAPKISAFEILDLQGRSVKFEKLNSQTTQLQLQLHGQLPNSAYVLRVFGVENQLIATEPFLIQQN